MAIAMEIYEKIRYYREHTDYSQRNVAKILGVSRNTVLNGLSSLAFRISGAALLSAPPVGAV